jgi:hypothetical protein
MVDSVNILTKNKECIKSKTDKKDARKLAKDLLNQQLEGILNLAIIGRIISDVRQISRNGGI